MMRSLFSGVSGLRTHQTRMDVIGNNIANVNTTAYKAKQMNFSDMLYQTTQAATGANAANGTGGTNPRQIGLGVKAAAINTTITQEGANQSTGNPFDLKISGEAFFVVSDGTSTFYTRDGSFDVDDAGNLCMASTGYIVQGWGVDKETGNIIKGTVGPINTNAQATYEADATKNVQFNGIIDAGDLELQTEKGKVVNVPIYDKAGYSYNLKFGILPVKGSQAGTRLIANTEDEYTPVNKLYQVDISTLKYNYTIGTSATKELKESDMPEELLSELEKAVWSTVNGTAAQGVTAVTGYKQGDKGDWVTVDMKTFIENNAKLKDTVLADSDLRKMSVTVNFSGGVGYTTSSSASYPLKNVSYIKVDPEAVNALYQPGTAANGKTEFTLKTTNTGVTSIKQVYSDGDDIKTDYVFRGSDGNDIQALGADGATGAAGKLYASDIVKILGLTKATATNSYTTVEEKTTDKVIDKQYTLTLLGMTNDSQETVDISALTNGGATSWELRYNTQNGAFDYVGLEGEKAFTLNLGAVDGKFDNVKVDMSGTSNVSNDKKSTVEGKRLDGRKVGKLLGVSVGTDGLLTASYSNGQSMAIGQICVAKFANAMGLENAGDNLYQTTASSGDASLVDIKADGIGSIASGMLEMSNVDLSQQFTDMITTQRGFQANSRIITTSDTLLEELVNLKR